MTLPLHTLNLNIFDMVVVFMCAVHEENKSGDYFF